MLRAHGRRPPRPRRLGCSVRPRLPGRPNLSSAHGRSPQPRLLSVPRLELGFPLPGAPTSAPRRTGTLVSELRRRLNWASRADGLGTSSLPPAGSPLTSSKVWESKAFASRQRRPGACGRDREVGAGQKGKPKGGEVGRQPRWPGHPFPSLLNAGSGPSVLDRLGQHL